MSIFHSKIGPTYFYTNYYKTNEKQKLHATSTNTQIWRIFFVITLFIQKVTKIFSIAELKVEAIEATKF